MPISSVAFSPVGLGVVHIITEYVGRTRGELLFIQFMLYCFQIPSAYVKVCSVFFSNYYISIISEIHTAFPSIQYLQSKGVKSSWTPNSMTWINLTIITHIVAQKLNELPKWPTDSHWWGFTLILHLLFTLTMMWGGGVASTG